jgi:glyoxylase-like metal-dependent hydrolase (beta-lactamase superfamily II)
MTLLPHIRRLIYSTSEIVPDVYQLTIRGVNVILIVEEEITLIDIGLRGNSPQIIDFINQIGRSPQEISLIIFTHNHLDHMGGLAEMKQLTRARIAIHKADIIGTENQPSFAEAIRTPPLELLSSTLQSAISVKFNDVDIQLSGGEVLEPLGGLEVIHTPGHTPGSISLYSPHKKLVIVGDAIRNRKRTLYLPPKMASTDMVQAADSIKKIARLDFDILCSGHGRPYINNARARVQALADKS